MNAIKLENKKSIIVTGYSCNSRCVFCSAYGHNRLQQRSYDDIIRNLMRDYQHGCRSLELIGGEVTIRPDIVKIISYAQKIGYQDIMMETNGRMFAYAEFTKEMILAGLNDICFSIHGHSALIHDKLTQTSGSFDQAVAGLKEVSRYSDIKIRCHCVLTKANYRHISEYLGYFGSFPLTSFLFSLVQPIPPLIAKYGNFVPRIRAVMPYLKSVWNEYPQFLIEAQHIPPCFTTPEYRQFLIVCQEKDDSFISDEKDKAIKLSWVINQLKIKPSVCQSCQMSKTCEGIWREYLKIFGEKEIKPIKIK